MGNAWDCCNGKTSQVADAKTPLLSSNDKQRSEGAPVAVTAQPRAAGLSARQFKPEEKEEKTSLDALQPISLGHIPNMPHIDKTFQDHAKLYNDMYAQFVELKKCLHDFKAKFVVDTAGIPVISECLRLLAQRCGDVSLTGSRSKHCIQILYDPRLISKTCKAPVEDVLETLELYNKANKLIGRILDKSHQVQSSINLVLEEEEKIKREVTKADPDGKLGPGPLRMATENLIKIHKVPERIDAMHTYTSKAFKEINEGSKALFKNAESSHK